MFIYAKLPFEIKGYILSFLGNYVFRKGRINEIFMYRIPKKKIKETEIILSKIPIIITALKTNIFWRVYIEFTKVSFIWKIIHQNYEYIKDEDTYVRIIRPEIVCYYEIKYY